MRQQLLLLEDVDGLGRKGTVVSPKPGHSRNYLLPKGKALVASKQALKMQEKLKEEREKQAVIDRKESEAYAAKLKDVVLEHEVKVDPDGKMYGSVTQMEIVRLLQEAGHSLERRNLLLPHPIKTLGTHTVSLRLKEGVEAEVKLKVKAEGGKEPAPVLSEEIVEKPSE